MPKTVKSLPEDKTGCGSLPFSVARSRAPFCSLLLARGRPRFGLRLRLARTSRSFLGLSFSARTSVLALVRFFDLWTLVAASCVFYTVSGKKKIQRAHNRRSLLFSSSAREVPFGHATEDETRFRADDLGFLLGLLLGLLLEVAFVRRGARRTHTKAIFMYKELSFCCLKVVCAGIYFDLTNGGVLPSY